MKKLICACIAALHLASCTTLATVPYSDGKFAGASVRAGDRVVLKTGARVYDFEVASVTAEEICGKDDCVRTAEIQSVERKEISVPWTVLAVVLIAAIVIGIGAAGAGAVSFGP